MHFTESNQLFRLFTAFFDGGDSTNKILFGHVALIETLKLERSGFHSHGLGAGDAIFP